MADTEYLRRLKRQLTDDGKLIEAGWVGLRIAAISPDVGKVQLEEMRTAFFAGAQHLFSSIMAVLDDGEEATADDMRRLSLISDELNGFIRDFSRRHNLPGSRTQ